MEPTAPQPVSTPELPSVPLAEVAGPTPREVERELRELRYLLHVAMGVAVVLLVTTTLSLFHQIRWLASQAGQWNATSIELGKAVNEYETNTLPQMNRMVADFQRYAEHNAEFDKIMARYRLVPERGGTNRPNVTPLVPAEPAP